MKVATTTLVINALAGATMASKMERLMQIKLDHRSEQRSSGAFDPDRYKAQATVTRCVNGTAGEYQCRNINMHAFLRHQDMGSETREGNDIWGWASSTGREFGAVGQTDGTAFVELNPDGSLTYLGRLPTQTVSSSWRDMKVIGDYIYIGSEASNHGLQVFDMKKLLNIPANSPKRFSITADLTARYTGFTNSHNIAANEATKMIYAVGTSSRLACKAGLWMLDVSDPANPKNAGCAGQDGYVHDAQCVVYAGPDTQYTGSEICFNFNEDTLTIVDVTDRESPQQISRTMYDGAAYTHQGWLATEDMSYLLLDDELDEMDGTGPAANGHTTTRIFDVSKLAAPKLTGIYQSPVRSIDHNQYVLNGLSYQANYGSGLRIVDVSSVATDPTGNGFKEVGFFDCHPEDDENGGDVKFVGAWSVYPYFKSGYILLNSIERGVYSLKYTG